MTDEKKSKDETAEEKLRLQESILRSIKPDTSEMTGKWVVDLKSGDGKVDVPLGFDEQTAEKFPDDMRSWVDKMFDEFQRYMGEYNKYQDAPDKLINSERPVFVKATVTGSLKYQSNVPIQTFFQGHLYTTQCALVVRGEEFDVKAWVVPINYVVAFDTRADHFQPYFRMKGARNQKNMLIWHVDAAPISYEAINAISKALFSALVRASRDELREGERFSLGAAEVQEASKLDTQQFIQRYTIPPGQFLQTQAGQPPVALAPPPPPPPPTPLPDRGYGVPPTPQFSYQPAQPTAAPSAQFPTQPTAAPSAQFPTQPTAAPSARPYVQESGQAGTPQANSQQADLVFQALGENMKSCMAACQTATQSLNVQMDLLNKIGVAALHAQSMDAVMQVMKRTNALRHFRDKIDALVEELNSIEASK